METYALKKSSTMQELVGIAQGSADPVSVFDGEDECLIAMTPAVFERILFDSDLLNRSDRSALHL